MSNEIESKLLSFIGDKKRNQNLTVEGIVDAVTAQTTTPRKEVEAWLLNLISEGYVSQINHDQFFTTERAKLLK